MCIHILHSSVMWMIIVAIILVIPIVTVSSSLPLCPNAADGMLCKSSPDYENAFPPKPFPTLIHASTRIGTITNVNENEHSITIRLEIILEWINQHVTIKNPNSSWYEISLDNFSEVWNPNIYFDKVLKVTKISTFGKTQTFDFWLKPQENKMWYIEALEITFACELDFSEFPFDEHNCSFVMGDIENGIDWMMFNNSKFEYNGMIVEDYTSSFEMLDSTTPYRFKLSKLKDFTKIRAPNTFHFIGIQVDMKRKGLGTLLNTFYVPTAMFAIISMISFTVEPSCVPGRMGLIVTLLLISSNVYSIVEAPKSRGLSHIEIWIIGSQLPILFSLFEYGIILLMTRNWKPTLNYFHVDIISLTLTALFYALFNTYYWT